LAHIEARLSRLGSKAIARAESKAVAKISRVMEVLTAQMEGEAPAEWETATVEGKEVKVRSRYKPQAAAIWLGTMLTAAAQKPQQNNTLILAGLDPALLREVYRQVLSQQGAIDVEAMPDQP
jgi:hypothetical protein